jgi:F-type H+-transporting ATPase subunit b
MHLVPNLWIIALQMLPFLVLVFALKPLIFDPLLDYLEERHHRITGFAHDARELEAETERQMREVETQLAQARAQIAESRLKMLQTATAEQQRIVGEARARAESQIDQFRVELAETRRVAGERLRTEVEGLSQDIASRVLGRALV